MSESFAVNATIDRPIDEVWVTLTDWDNADRWMSGIDSLTANGPLEVGTTLTFRARGKDRPSEIAALDMGRSVTLRSKQGGVVADYQYELRAVSATTTEASLVAECTTRGLLWNALSPLLRFAMRRSDRGQIDALKNVVESTKPDNGTEM